MDTPTYDIAISGAGPAGSALALALARKSPRPRRIALVGPRFAVSRGPATEPNAAIDPRTLALNHGSRVLLEQLAAWPSASADIATVHVSQRGRLGRTLIRHDELEVPRLGSVVGYDDLLSSLHRALLDSGVALIEASPTLTLAAGQVELDLGASRIRSALAVQSDGIRPQGIERQYRQDAVLATVRSARPRPGWAFERFTRNGPLAILPHPHGDDLYGVVWCCPPAEAGRIRALDDKDFAEALYGMFGSRLGRFQPVGDRHVFPLSMHAGPSLINARCVAIGNAAQTLHPVAGQGLNLGLRDVAQLTHVLAPWLARPEADPAGLLAQFARQRRPDRWLTAGITDFLPRVFATGNPLVDHAGGLALLTLDILPALRDPLARHLLQGLRN
ncbi:FAD-dependent monooxygenase [Pollutimonas sp. H1-120]|uniref:FAD-dependent monooxygenase n=1 Tax=Pollutimonas sp. H1-120 TaxID=3148824 RepID=UPI003B52957A